MKNISSNSSAPSSSSSPWRSGSFPALPARLRLVDSHGHDFAGGHISGGILTRGHARRLVARKMRRERRVPYWIAQLLAGLVAALLVVAIFAKPAWRPASHLASSSLILFTFALAWVVLNSATAKARPAIRSMVWHWLHGPGRRGVGR